jgi:hypothetical protein
LLGQSLKLIGQGYNLLASGDTAARAGWLQSQYLLRQRVLLLDQAAGRA